MPKTIETHLPHLSQPSAKDGTGQVLWACRSILAGSAGQNAVASALSPWHKRNTLRQYLREWLYDSSDHTSPCQTQLDVALCLEPLLRWVLAWWSSGRLAMAIDPTLKGEQAIAIVICVLYRPTEAGTITVAWRIRRANQQGSWADSTVELLKELAPAVAEEMTVIALCARGITSPKLWQQVRAKTKPRCTLLVLWYAEQTEPSTILTAPTHISRHWLVLSVATLLAQVYGTRVEDAQDRRIDPGNPRAPPKALAPKHRDPRSRPASTVRHRLASALAARRTPLDPRLAAARTLATTQT